jgi:hypothetical protein
MHHSAKLLYGNHFAGFEPLSLLCRWVREPQLLADSETPSCLDKLTDPRGGAEPIGPVSLVVRCR